jgi:signal peptidase II
MSASDEVAKEPTLTAAPSLQKGEVVRGGESADDKSTEAGTGGRVRDLAAGDPGDAVVVLPLPPRPSYAFLAVSSALSLAADLASKYWVTSRLDNPASGYRPRVEVWGDRVAFISARNKGGAWGLLGGEAEWVRLPFFVLVSVGAVLFILSMYRKLEPQQRALKWGLPLVLGGALGNFVDRLRYGAVVDFIDVRLTATYHWPTFNVADIAICVGVGLMAIDMFTPRPQPSPAPGAAPGAQADGR